MSKRTRTDSRAFNPNDFFPTPREAALPLIRHLPACTRFIEPCAGDYSLAGFLEEYGHTCVDAFDIAPQSPFVRIENALNVRPAQGLLLVTNPPFAWPLLRPLLDHWIGSNPVWLLLPADMICNKRFNSYARHIDQLVPVGRVSWLGNGTGGFENFMWMHFATSRQPFIMERK
jgi:hypothetical protein